MNEHKKNLLLKKLVILLILVQIPCIHYSQIVADHSVVDLYDDIPQQWIDSVKTMLVDIAGESHSEGYRDGMELLEAEDATYQVTTYNLYGGALPAPSSSYVRIGRHNVVGEEDFFTSASAIAEYKALIVNQNETSNPYSVMGFGWCWDMSRDGARGTVDPVYDVRWAGSSVGGPDGNQEWGLDSDDEALTGNSVCMDTYLDAVEQYNQLCRDSGYSTIMIFTTGPVDDQGSGTEAGLQREIKHQYIRDYVAADETRVLFDYADILCWNNSGEKNTVIWDDDGEDREYDQIHPDNLEGGYTAHIGNVGALRLAKAMWWMLARIAGWDGGTTTIPVTGIVVTSAGSVTEILSGETLQFSAEVSPADATNKNISWSVTNGTGTATIDSDGLLTAGDPGTVTVEASAQDGSGISGTFALTIEIGTGISIQGDEDPFLLYPNPGTGLFYLETGQQEVDLLKILSLDGSVVKEVVPEKGATKIELDLTNQAPGMFVIKAYMKELQILKSAIIIQ